MPELLMTLVFFGIPAAIVLAVFKPWRRRTG